ncbi:MAG: hypothetical protein ABI234_04235 [Ktedonobacteraceae bacterium]
MDESLHTPDFTAPDFTQPALQQTDLATPGFTLPNPNRPDPAIAADMAPWPHDMEQLPTDQPDPSSPDLDEPDMPADLTMPAADVHVLPEPSYAPDVVMAQRPGEMDPQALETLLGSADDAELPPDISYPQLYTNQDEMSKRKRHLGMLELGLERTERAEP